MNQRVLRAASPQKADEWIAADATNVAAWLMKNSDQPLVQITTVKDEPLLTAHYGLIVACGDSEFLVGQLLPALTAMQMGTLPVPPVIEARIGDALADPIMPDWNCLKGMGISDDRYFAIFQAMQEKQAAQATGRCWRMGIQEQAEDTQTEELCR